MEHVCTGSMTPEEEALVLGYRDLPVSLLFSLEDECKRLGLSTKASINEALVEWLEIQTGKPALELLGFDDLGDDEDGDALLRSILTPAD